MKDLLLLLFIPFIVCDPFLLAPFDCSRVNIAFCCTSRIRSICPLECSSIVCHPSFYHTLFSTDSIGESVVKESERGMTEWSFKNGRFREGIQGPQSIPFSIGGSRDGDVTILSPQSVTSLPTSTTTFSAYFGGRSTAKGFPTLLPSEKQVSVTESTTTTTTIPPTTTTTTVRTTKIKRRTTPDPRIIKPPKELLIIGEEDEDEPPETVPATVIPSMPRNTDQVTEEPEIREVKEQKGPSWHAAILPHTSDSIGMGPREEGTDKLIKIFAVDGSTSGQKPIGRGRIARFQENIDSGVNTQEKATDMHQRAKNGIGLSFSFKPRFINKEIASASMAGNGPNIDTEAFIPPSYKFVSEFSSSLPPTTSRPHTTLTLPHSSLLPLPISPLPPLPPSQCGVAPQFVPCLSAGKASERLLSCCKAKGLPQGCQDLCRYDITQNEVRAAMDAGRCGLLSVQPYLECASQGHDNTECCRQRGIGQRSGMQCEDLCRPSQFRPLGLQHIVCGTVIKELLQCHHSGVRE